MSQMDRPSSACRPERGAKTVKLSRDDEFLKRAVIRDTASMREAFVSLDASGVQIVLITNAEQRVVGLATDGDLRRALLRGAMLTDPIAPHMRSEFKWVS